MSKNPDTTPLHRRLRRLELRDVADDYPTPEHISYIAKLGDARAFFLTDDRYSHDWFYPRYRGGRLHEPALTRHLFASLTPESVFLDVGAHLGYFSIIAALRAKAVFAIEPQEFLIGRIHSNASANHLDNVTLIHAAAGDAPGFAQVPKIGTPKTRLGASENLVPMIRLDDYFTGEWQPTHVKIDTEGFEYHVLTGARGLLARRPTLYIEYHHGMTRFGPSGEDMWDFLHDHGYRIGAGNHRQPSGDFLDVPRDELQDHRGSMLVCRPRDSAPEPV